MFETFTTVFSSNRSKIKGLTGEIDVVLTVFFVSVLTGIDVSGEMLLWSFGEQGTDSSKAIHFSEEGFPSKSSKSLGPSSSQKSLPLKLWNCIRWKVALRLVSNYCSVLLVCVAFQCRIYIYTAKWGVLKTAANEFLHQNCPRLWNRFLSLFLTISKKHKTLVIAHVSL